jgi:hypothetical protein
VQRARSREPPLSPGGICIDRNTSGRSHYPPSVHPRRLCDCDLFVLWARSAPGPSLGIVGPSIRPKTVRPCDRGMPHIRGSPLPWRATHSPSATPFPRQPSCLPTNRKIWQSTLPVFFSFHLLPGTVLASISSPEKRLAQIWRGGILKGKSKSKSKRLFLENQTIRRGK